MKGDSTSQNPIAQSPERAQASGRTTIVLSLLLTGIALVVVGLSRFMFNLVVGRLESFDLVGEINIALAAAILLSMGVSSGIAPAATRSIAERCGARDPAGVRLAFFFTLKLALVVGSLVALVAALFVPWLSAALGTGGPVLLLSLPYVIANGLYWHMRSSLYGLGKVAAYVWAELAGGAALFASLSVLLALRATDWLILCFLVGNLAFLAVSALQVCAMLGTPAPASQGPGPGTNTLTRHISSFAAIAFAGTFASTSKYYLAPLMLGVWVPDREVGYFSTIMSFLLVLLLIPRCVSTVFFPEFAHMDGQRDARRFRRLLGSTTLWTNLGAVLACGCILVLFGPFLALTLGDGYGAQIGDRLAVLYGLLVLAAYLVVIATPANSALSGTKHYAIPTIGGIAGLAVCLVVWLLTIPSLGVVGAGLGFVAGTLADSLIVLYFASNMFRLRLGAAARSAALGASMAISGLLVSFLDPFFGPPGGLVLFLVLFLGVFRSDVRSVLSNLSSAFRGGRTGPPQLAPPRQPDVKLVKR